MIAEKLDTDTTSPVGTRPHIVPTAWGYSMIAEKLDTDTTSPVGTRPHIVPITVGTAKQKSDWTENSSSEPVPIARDTDGVFRVGGTRVTLDTVITAYKQNETPEEIAENYDVLSLADVYAVITYYLRHQEEVEDYLRQREERAEAIRREIEAYYKPEGTRERLLKRLAEKKQKS